MQNLHDDKFLDDLSRDAAERFDTDPDLHSWNKLLPRLEAELPEKEKKRRFLFIILLFLLVGGGIVTYGVLAPGGTRTAQNDAVKENPVKEKSVKENLNNNKVQTDKPEKLQEQKTDKTTDDASVHESATDQTKQTTGISENVVIDKTSKNKKQRSQKEKLITAKQSIVWKTEQPTKKSKQTISNKSTTELDDPKQSVKQPEINDVNNVADAPIAKSSAIATDKPAEEKPAADKQEDKPIDETKKPEESKPQAGTPNNEQSNNKKKKQDNKFKRWEAGLVYAPDISTVRFTHTQKPGINVGINIGYNISRRWQINAGALYTTKNYEINGKDYHPPKGYWTDYVKLTTVEGSCNMWDIPVNVRYNIVPRKSSNLFASAGFSSYIMKKEDYDYYYYYGSNPNIVSRNRTYDNVGNYWFSVVNLSVGYEKQVGKHISLQAEPFFKQPLKGVGFGNIKLNTTGIFFTGKYKF